MSSAAGRPNERSLTTRQLTKKKISTGALYGKAFSAHALAPVFYSVANARAPAALFVDTSGDLVEGANADTVGKLLRGCLVATSGDLLWSAYADTVGRLLRGCPVDTLGDLVGDA